VASKQVAEQVQQLIETIDALTAVVSKHKSGDAEATHSEEDQLLWDFVYLVHDIAAHPKLRAVASALIRLDDTERIRWYA